jgi:hypothetical protein
VGPARTGLGASLPQLHCDSRDSLDFDSGDEHRPPVEPRCLRWTFPVWNPDDSLDPEALRVEGRKRKREKQETEPAPTWTARQFVETFFGDEPTTLAEVREAAAGMPGLSTRRVGDLLSIAEQRRLVTRVTLPGRGGPQGFKAGDRR